AAPILDDQRRAVIGAVTILLRRDTLFQSIAEGSFGATGHAMLFASDGGGVVICPVLAPEAHSIDAELLGTMGAPKPGWAVAADDSHGNKRALIGFAPVRIAGQLATGSLGGKRWITLVRQDAAETFAPLGELVTKMLLLGSVVLMGLGGIGVIVARRIARP